MKLVILDWATLSGEDAIEFHFPDCVRIVERYGLTAPEEAAERIGDAELLICNKVPITADVIARCPRLQFIGLLATGWNNVDIEAARARGICVCNAGSYSTNAVAQLVFSYILMHYSRLDLYNLDVRLGKWIQSPTFSWFPHAMHELAGKTISIIGYGNIGKQVAKLADAFGMNIYISTRTVPKDCPYPVVGLDEAFFRADILTLHCPLTPDTEKLVDDRRLKLMKPSAIVINTSRGGTVDEVALAAALNTDQLGGAYLDVLQQEPMSPDTPLHRAKNCVITPHIAWAPLETRLRLVRIVEENLRAFLNGTPQNRVC